MNNVLLISETKVREFTDINKNVDSKLITSNILLAQDITVQRLVGTKLYQKLMSDIQNNTLTGNYQTLLDNFVQPVLLWASYYEILEAIFARPRNNGLLKPTGGENSESVDQTMYDRKRDSARSRRDFYAETLARYLIDFQSQFPEISSTQYLYQMYPDFGQQFRGPIVFSTNARGRYLEYAMKNNLPIVDSAWPQFPPPNIYNK